MVEKIKEDIKLELRKQIEAMEKAKEEAEKEGEQFLAFEEAVLTLLRAQLFLIKWLDEIIQR